MPSKLKIPNLQLFTQSSLCGLNPTSEQDESSSFSIFIFGIIIHLIIVSLVVMTQFIAFISKPSVSSQGKRKALYLDLVEFYRIINIPVTLY
jgi:flagellar basal body-associated protein FliL